MLVGQFNVNFTLLFPIIRQVLESLARCQPKNEFWDTYTGILKHVDRVMTSSEGKAHFMAVNFRFISF